MSKPKKHRDDEVTQQIRVGREALDEALRESEAAARRIQSSVPPGAPEEAEPSSSEDEDDGEKQRETQP